MLNLYLLDNLNSNIKINPNTAALIIDVYILQAIGSILHIHWEIITANPIPAISMINAEIHSMMISRELSFSPGTSADKVKVLIHS